MVLLRRAIGTAGTKPGTLTSFVRGIYNREIVKYAVPEKASGQRGTCSP